MAKGFQFRFESLLQLRRQECDAVSKEVADANRAVEILQQQSQEITAERASTRRAASQHRESQTLSIDRLLHQGRYDLQLVAQLQDLATKTEQIHRERDRRLMRLREANAEVRRLERLKERQQEAWRKNELAAEQIALDEIAAGRFLRRRRAADPLGSRQE